jgi:hypothetical protein
MSVNTLGLSLPEVLLRFDGDSFGTESWKTNYAHAFSIKTDLFGRSFVAIIRRSHSQPARHEAPLFRRYMGRDGECLRRTTTGYDLSSSNHPAATLQRIKLMDRLITGDRPSQTGRGLNSVTNHLLMAVDAASSASFNFIDSGF